MKPLFFAAAAAFAFGNVYATPAGDTSAHLSTSQAQTANEAAGLPDLTKINRPSAEITSKVEFNNVQRTPSFYEKSNSGTEVIEYRDRGKPVEIDVKSNFGTRYQMTASPDTSPRPYQANRPVTRLPSVNLHY